ncbi:sh3 domain-containing protein c23a1.17 [Anaeramoeba ignava]|uniref:Sh3 domain-containing protein c23a1.17 n=1 Tax=Anaeramoeba ignava TaxID=1746090 RepID=A0A9Q0LF69_ANAIG|nr:sh3 domain-containing protein c23a1.17 [Anaeramoeba ignava]
MSKKGKNVQDFSQNEGLEALQMIRQLDPNTVRWQSAVDTFESGRFEEAFAVIEKLPESAKTYFNLGLISMKMKKYEEAVRNFTESIKRDKFMAITHFQRGICHHISNNIAAAVIDYTSCLEAMKLNPTINYEQMGMKYKLSRTEVLFNRAVAFCSVGLFHRAFEDLHFAYERANPKAPGYNVIQSLYQEVKCVRTTGGDLFISPQIFEVVSLDTLSRKKITSSTSQSDPLGIMQALKNKKAMSNESIESQLQQRKQQNMNPLQQSLQERFNQKNRKNTGGGAGPLPQLPPKNNQPFDKEKLPQLPKKQKSPPLQNNTETNEKLPELPRKSKSPSLQKNTETNEKLPQLPKKPKSPPLQKNTETNEKLPELPKKQKSPPLQNNTEDEKPPQLPKKENQQEDEIPPPLPQRPEDDEKPPQLPRKQSQLESNEKSPHLPKKQEDDEKPPQLPRKQSQHEDEIPPPLPQRPEDDEKPPQLPRKQSQNESNEKPPKLPLRGISPQMIKLPMPNDPNSLKLPPRARSGNHHKSPQNQNGIPKATKRSPSKSPSNSDEKNPRLPSRSQVDHARSGQSRHGQRGSPSNTTQAQPFIPAWAKK